MVFITATVLPPQYKEVRLSGGEVIQIRLMNYKQPFNLKLSKPLPNNKGFLPLLNKECQCYKSKDLEFIKKYERKH